MADVTDDLPVHGYFFIGTIDHFQPAKQKFCCTSDMWRFSAKGIQLVQNNYGERVLLMSGEGKKVTAS